jgi:hypothetical protein
MCVTYNISYSDLDTSAIVLDYRIIKKKGINFFFFKDSVIFTHPYYKIKKNNFQYKPFYPTIDPISIHTTHLDINLFKEIVSHLSKVIWGN